MSFWENKRVLVTGGGGFLGSYVLEKLEAKGCNHIFSPSSRDFDLTQESNIQTLYEKTKPDVVIHLAALVGGIGANRRYPGTFFYKNLMMGTQMMEYGRSFGIDKFVGIGTICAYPKHTKIPFKEKDLWKGYPEETNAPYGLAKKMMLVQSQAYRDEFGFNSIFLLPVNMYGPHDNFDLATSHVIPAVIRKCIEAQREKNDEIICWGTGKVSREFLYAEDCAEAILLATEKYNNSEPVNIGTGKEILIEDLVCLISQLTGFKGKIKWDATKPDGQPRRCLDVSKAKKEFGFEAKTDLYTGLVKTIEWYKNNYD